MHTLCFPDPINRATLDAIETAQAVFSLDHTHSSEEYSDRRGLKYWDEHKTMLANRYLHGNGSNQYSCNRWFDAAILVRASLCMHRCMHVHMNWYP